jgi:glycine/D-amino acid oxidase-like deaminating enzyme
MVYVMNRILIFLTFSLFFFSCQDAMEMEEIVVIGGGLMGSSTAWELSKNGEKVLLIEQQDSVYTFGSSLGEARISRSLGPKNDIFSFLQKRSVAETKELIEYLNQAEPGEKHSMEDIYRTSPVSYIRYKSQQEAINLLLEEQEDKYEYAPDRESARKLFGMEVPDSVRIIREYKEYSGTLNPGVLISKLHKGITSSGNRIRYNERVISLKRKDSHYEVLIENTKTGEPETIISKKVVAAAGPYNGELVKEVAPYFQELITPKRLFLAFLRIKPAVYNNLSLEQKDQIEKSYPVADIDSEIFYSMIENYDDNGMPILKVGGHFLRTTISDLNEVWKMELDEQEIEWSKTNTLEYLRMLNLPIQDEDLQFVRGYSCVYSLTDSEIPYVTNAVSSEMEIDPNFILVGGMSGIGAKGALSYGLMASNLLLGKNDTSLVYQKAMQALGTDRLLEDLSNLKIKNR